MYEFNVMDILKEEDGLSSSQIYLRHLNKYDYGNRHRIVQVLSRLIEKGLIKCERERKVFYYYVL